MIASRRTASVLSAALALAATGAWAQKTELLVYTALETDQLKAYTESFQKTNPTIDLKFVRDSTGVITAKILAEKANPPSWVGMDVFAATVCYNTVEGKKKNIPKPESWADLAKPVYKGQVTMPNPASSGTGFLAVSGWLQGMGEAAGWKYMDQLHENVAQYTHSGSKPCRQAGAGEFVVGISFDFRGNDVKAKGAPVDLVFPKEGLGWDIEGSAIVKTTKKMDAAKKLMDWVATKEANEAYAKNFAIVAHPDVKPALPHLPADLDKRLAKNDFAFAAKNREKILAEWQKRYDAKSEPKK